MEEVLLISHIPLLKKAADKVTHVHTDFDIARIRFSSSTPNVS